MQQWVSRGGSVCCARTGRLSAAEPSGKALRVGSAMAAALGAGLGAAVSLPADVGVPVAHGTAALSLLARARMASGRVRLRLLLFASALAAGGFHHLFTRQLPASPQQSAGVFQSVVQLLAVAGVAVCLGLSVVGLVVAAADSGTFLTSFQRVLDGWMITGSLLTLGWVLLLHRAGQGGDVSASLLGSARVVTDVCVLGLLVALRYGQKPAEREAVTLSVVALVILTLSDTLRILLPDPGTWYGIPLPAAGSMTGLFLVAATPWLPGGASIMRADQRVMPVVGVVAAFVPVLVCALSLAAHTLAGGRIDVVMVVLAGSVLLGLGARQAVAHADHLRITRETAAREDLYRTMVDGSCDVITIAGPDSRVRYVSPAAYPMFGYRPEELVGARLPLYCHPEDLAPLMQAIEALLRDTRSGTRGPVRSVSCRVRAADGRWRHVESTISRHTQGMIFSSRDVTERVRRQEQLEHLAFHDTLTGLPHRGLFADRVAHALRKRSAGAHPPAVLFVDLDGFKAVNDTLGHAAGDALLVQVARRLQASMRAGDTIARLGGDEFAALLEGEAGTRPTSAREVAERILSALTKPYRIGGTDAVVSASIGVAVATPGITPEEILHHADQAMYEAKSAGKSRIHMHHSLSSDRTEPRSCTPL
ncbi:sensor domain-containing diguanylate cyclase [Streptomyces sporangiiformans]|uniref:Sensor domain-containing diguanylate cyclase n=1 Tax=Streptomyces sporangiiformans TaxID=2315329 RepID=A0A505DPT5_9ACTN|nr:sensor domain-containing diguanylate cyclase [Streptomyces sporangiiformans]